MSELTEEIHLETRETIQRASLKIEWKIHKTTIDELHKEKFGKRQSPLFKSKFFNSTWTIELLHQGEITSEDFKVYPVVKSASVGLENIWLKYKVITKNVDPDKNATEGYNLSFPASRYENYYSELNKTTIDDVSFYHDNYLILILEINVKVLGAKNTSLSIKKLEHHGDTLVKKYEKLLNSGIYSDITLCVGDQKFNVHKNILASNCEYFQAMFKDGFKESTEKEIEIPDVDPKIFEIILKFIYNDQLPEDLEPIAKELLPAADRFLVPPVVKKCKDKLCEMISLENCVELLILADTFNQAELKLKVFSFIGCNMNDVIKSEAWKMLKKNYSTLAFETMEHFYN